MLDPLPVEMSDASFEKLFNGVGETRKPLEELYPLLEKLNAVLLENAGHPSYNPKSNTINDFKWAHVRYGGNTPLCSGAHNTRKGHSGAVKLNPKPEGKIQGGTVVTRQTFGV